MIPKNIFIAYNDDVHIRKGEVAAHIGVVDTACSVRDALTKMDITPTVVGLKDDPEGFIRTLRQGSPDIIFNLCEEAFGISQMEMNVAAIYEIFGFRYTGSGPLTLGLCLNKEMTKDILSSHKIPTPDYMLVDSVSNLEDVHISFPIIVKPVSEDAGLGIDANAVVFDLRGLKKRIEYIMDIFKQPAIIEEYIDGREFNVSIIGNANPKVLSVSEIDFSGLPSDIPRIVGYEAKWITTSVFYKKTVPVCPAKIPDEIEKRITSIALKAYKMLGLRDYARIDMRMGHDNMPKVLEANPNPDISPDAGFARSALGSGFSYSELICGIIECAMERYGCKDTKGLVKRQG